MKFTDILQSQAVKEQLPFEIDFVFSPDVHKNRPTEAIAGYNIPVLNELTVFESWWLEYLNGLSDNTLADVRLEWRSLAMSLKKELNLPFTLTECAVLITGQLTDEMKGKPEYEAVLNDSRLEEWSYKHEESYAKLLQLNQLTSNPLILNALRITAFMKGRVDPLWDTHNSFSLTSSEAKAIMKFITKEANGGQDPDAIADEPSESEEEGKAPKKLRGGTTGA